MTRSQSNKQVEEKQFIDRELFHFIVITSMELITRANKISDSDCYIRMICKNKLVNCLSVPLSLSANNPTKLFR